MCVKVFCHHVRLMSRYIQQVDTMGMGTSGWTAIVAILHNLWQNCCGINCPVTLAHSGTGIWVTGPFASKNNAYRILWAVWLWHPYFSILNFQPYSIYTTWTFSCLCNFITQSLELGKRSLSWKKKIPYFICMYVNYFVIFVFTWLTRLQHVNKELNLYR